ncbi:hypothetical protein [Paraburkholderia panacisoli]|uniref:hypothetical protein n=1 Tax=Paraburkholderia panacisoli TaxID=2603818 RepID=UPI00165FED92|nr:hypothetical protein [Paraburkholderia panacisoli]
MPLNGLRRHVDREPVVWARVSASANAALGALRGEVAAQRAEAQLSVAAARDELGRVEFAALSSFAFPDACQL